MVWPWRLAIFRRDSSISEVYRAVSGGESDASAVDGSWTTGVVAPGKSATLTFDKPGRYMYTDKQHPWSYAELVVEE